MKKHNHHLWGWVTGLVLLAIVAWLMVWEQQLVLTKREVSAPAQGRAAFGSLISPDGQWKLQVKDTGDYSKAVSHVVRLVSLNWEADQELMGVDEKGDATNMDMPGTSMWRAAGWSADGKKVYVLTQKLLPDGTDFPTPNTFGFALHEVDIQTKEMKLVKELAIGAAAVDGYLDVHTQKDRVVYLDKEGLFLNRLAGGDKTPLENPGVMAAMLNPSADKLAVLVMEDVAPNKGLEERTEGDFKWYYGLIDVNTGRYKKMGELQESQVNWNKMHWIDDTSFIVGQLVVKL